MFVFQSIRKFVDEGLRDRGRYAVRQQLEDLYNASRHHVRIAPRRLLRGDPDYALSDAIIDVVADAGNVAERASGKEGTRARRTIGIVLALDAPRRRHDERRVDIDVEQSQIMGGRAAGNRLIHSSLELKQRGKQAYRTHFITQSQLDQVAVQMLMEQL